MVKRKSVDVIAHDPLQHIDEEIDSDSLEKSFVQEDHADSPEISKSTQNQLIFDDCLTIQEVGEFSMQVRSVFDYATEIVMDIDSLDRVDGCGVQLICAIVKEAVTQQVELKWVGESDALNRALDQMGVSDQVMFSINDVN